MDLGFLQTLDVQILGGAAVAVLAVIIGAVFLFSSKKPKGCLDPENFKEFKLVKRTQLSHNVAKFTFGLPTPTSVLGLPVGQHISCRFLVTTCRAVVLPCFGGPDVLELRPDVQVPNLKPNEVLVRARAVSINPLDTRHKSSIGLGYIDLSKRRVSKEDIQGCEERYNKSKLVHSIMRHVAETMGIDLEIDRLSNGLGKMCCSTCKYWESEVLGQCVIAPPLLHIIYEIVLYISFYIHNSVFT